MANSAASKVLVGVLIGGGAVWLASFAQSRIEVLQKYYYVPPLLLAGAAFLLYRRGRHTAAIGLAGAVGVMGLSIAQQKGYLGMPAPAPQATTTAGYPDAGRTLPGRTSGWREMPGRRQAGLLQGSASRALLQQQNAMGAGAGKVGYGEAGALMGAISEKVRDAMGLHS